MSVRPTLDEVVGEIHLARLLQQTQRQPVNSPGSVIAFATDRQGELRVFQHYFNRHRTHLGIGRGLSEPGDAPARLRLASHTWQRHCRGLYQTPIVA